MCACVCVFNFSYSSVQYDERRFGGRAKYKTSIFDDFVLQHTFFPYGKGLRT